MARRPGKFSFIKRSSLALCLLLACAQACLCVSLSAYKVRVHTAADALDALRWSADEDESEESLAAKERETLAQVREAVLKVETVEWNNTSVSVNNRWLDQSLRDYEKMEAGDERADEALLRMEERLYALYERLDEIETGRTLAAAQTDKDAEKGRLASILRREEYKGEEKGKEESAYQRLLKRISKWLEELSPDVKPIQPGQAKSFARVTQIIVIALCLATLIFVAWRYGPGLLARMNRRRGKKRKKREARVVLGERLELDQTGADLLSEAEALARRGELRAAIRKGYIALLCELADRKVLSLAQSKTNRDYLRSVAGREPLHTEMRVLTNLFESHWYGLAPAAVEDWTNFRAGYQRAVTSEES